MCRLLTFKLSSTSGVSKNEVSALANAKGTKGMRSTQRIQCSKSEVRLQAKASVGEGLNLIKSDQIWLYDRCCSESVKGRPPPPQAHWLTPSRGGFKIARWRQFLVRGLGVGVDLNFENHN